MSVELLIAPRYAIKRANSTVTAEARMIFLRRFISLIVTEQSLNKTLGALNCSDNCYNVECVTNLSRRNGLEAIYVYRVLQGAVCTTQPTTPSTGLGGQLYAMYCQKGPHAVTLKRVNVANAPCQQSAIASRHIQAKERVVEFVELAVNCFKLFIR